MKTKKQLHLVVDGTVQGVGFRFYVAEAARRLDLAGWVRNRPDGAVELCAAGDETDLSAFEAEVARGPAGAQVDRVQRLDPAASGQLTKPFSILRDR